MTPGLQRGPPFPKAAVKGAVVAIASLEAPTVPMAVGTCEIDVSSLGSVQGMKGHAVSTFHWAGDELWSWNPAGKPGTEAPGALQGWDEESEDATLAAQTAEVDLQDEQEGGIALNADPTERSAAEKAQGVEGEDAPSFKDAIDVVDDKELSQKGRTTIVSSLCFCTTNRIQKSTTLSGMPSCMAYAITWTTIKTTLLSVWTFRYPSQRSCLFWCSLFSLLIRRQGLLLYRSRRQAGRTSESLSNIWTNSKS